jgi:hypothetical protein
MLPVVRRVAESLNCRMISVLRDYLLQHKSLGIPGLGTIYIERVPAQSDFVNKRLLPPSFRFRFNTYSDAPDKEFFQFLANRNQVPEYEAIRSYNEWAADLRTRMNPGAAIEWTGIGTIKKDTSGEIQFESAVSPFSVLQPVEAERLIRSNSRHTMIVGDKEVTNVEMSDYLGDTTHVEKESWWIYALIVAAICLVMIFFHFYRNGVRLDASGNQQKIESR